MKDGRKGPVERPWIDDDLRITDLMLDLEETFGVTISDDEAERIRCFGNLKRIILARIPLVPAGGCATGRAFYRLRRAICRELGISRSAVRPGTRWTDLPAIPWETVGRLRNPRRRPRRERDSPFRAPVCCLVLLGAASYASILALLYPPIGVPALIAIAVFALAILPAGAGARAKSFRYRRTVGDGARLAAALGMREFISPRLRLAWTREEASLTIDRLILKHLKIDDFSDRCLPVEKPFLCPSFLE